MFKILKPTCGDFYDHYCVAQKKCIPVSDTSCGDPEDFTTFVAPSNQPVFCSDVERFTEASNYACPHIDTDLFVPEADYEIVYKTKTCTNKLGKLVALIFCIFA